MIKGMPAATAATSPPLPTRPSRSPATAYDDVSVALRLQTSDFIAPGRLGDVLLTDAVNEPSSAAAACTTSPVNCQRRSRPNHMIPATRRSADPTAPALTLQRNPRRWCRGHRPAPTRQAGMKTREPPMTDAYLATAVRTPIGRYGGALAAVRADDLGAVPLKALMERNPAGRLEAVDDVIYGCANQAGEDNRNVARMARAAGRPAGRGARRHRQPALRLRHGRRRHGGAGHQERRGRADDRRRRREHEPRALRHAQGRQPPSRAPCRDLRHHHRLALRQPADEGALRRRFHAGDRRERRRAISTISRADQDAFALRSQQRAARRRQRAASTTRSSPVDDPAAQGRPAGRRQRRAPAPETTPGGAGQAEGARAAGRHA